MECCLLKSSEIVVLNFYSNTMLHFINILSCETGVDSFLFKVTVAAAEMGHCWLHRVVIDVIDKY